MAPAIEPVTVSEAKQHLRVTGSLEDAYIAGLITKARRLTETYTGRALITQTLRYTADSFPCSRILRLERPPLLTVESIEYHDSNNDLQTLDDALYSVDILSTPGRVVLLDGERWPNLANEPNCVDVIFTAGYGVAPTSVPDELIQGILLLIGTFYENRESIAVQPNNMASILPHGFETLVLPYMVFW